MCATLDWQSAAVQENKSTSEVGHYKSLTDVSKMPIIVEDIDYNNHVRTSFLKENLKHCYVIENKCYYNTRD